MPEACVTMWVGIECATGPQPGSRASQAHAVHDAAVPLIRTVPISCPLYEITLGKQTVFARRQSAVGQTRLERTRGGYWPAGQKTSARTSILSRGAASGPLVGSSKAVCAENRARPSSFES